MNQSSMTIGWSTVMAQSQANESYYDCDWGVSPIPCDSEVCVTACGSCDWSGPCKDYDTHYWFVHVKKSGENPPPYNPGSGGGGGSGQGTNTDMNAIYIQNGALATNKMITDVNSGNYQKYIATIEDPTQKKVHIVNAMSNLSLSQTIVDQVINGISTLKSNPYYFALGKTLGNLGVGIGAAQTAMIISEGNYTLGDVLTIMSNAACGAGYFFEIVPATQVFGTTLIITGVVLGVISQFVNEIDIPLQDGRILHIKRLQA